MRVLKDILYKVEIDAVVGNTSVTINKLQFDSRKVELNDAFLEAIELFIFFSPRTSAERIEKQGRLFAYGG